MSVLTSRAGEAACHMALQTEHVNETSAFALVWEVKSASLRAVVHRTPREPGWPPSVSSGAVFLLYGSSIHTLCSFFYWITGWFKNKSVPRTVFMHIWETALSAIRVKHFFSSCPFVFWLGLYFLSCSFYVYLLRFLSLSLYGLLIFSIVRKDSPTPRLFKNHSCCYIFVFPI